MRPVFAIGLVFALVACNGLTSSDDKPASAAPADGAGNQGPAVTFHTPKGDVVVGVEVADTPNARAHGLMDRKELASDRGMIFLFPREDIQHFWMKNTYIPLDMIFVSTAREVVGVAANTEPLTLEERSVNVPSAYVVEVNGGFAAKHGIDKGVRVTFRGLSETLPKM